MHTYLRPTQTAAGGVAAGLVRYVLQQGRAALSTEVMEALLQLFVGLAAALAAVLVATGSHAEAEAAVAEAVAPAAAPPAHQEKKEGAAAAGDNGAADHDDCSDDDDDDDALDESAAPLAPAHFVAACKGDADKAQRRWDATRRWRREEGIDRLLFRPNTTMELARKYYPLWFHGRGRQGEVVLFEMAGAFSCS